MRRNLSLLVVFLLALLATACSSISSQAGLTGPTPTTPALRSGLRVLLVPAAGTSTPTAAALSAARATLTLRLAAFGFKNARVQELTSGGQPSLQVEVPHFGGDERTTLNLLLETGLLEFWNTGPSPVTLGSTFDPMHYTQYNPGNKPEFTGKDLDPNQLYVSQDQAGQPQISFAMKGSAIGKFSTFTASHIGDYLALTLDGTVVECAVIQGQIAGPAEITGNFTRQQATALVSVLKYSPLLVVLHIGRESTF